MCYVSHITWIKSDSVVIWCLTELLIHCSPWLAVISPRLIHHRLLPTRFQQLIHHLFIIQLLTFRGTEGGETQEP